MLDESFFRCGGHFEANVQSVYVFCEYLSHYDSLFKIILAEHCSELHFFSLTSKDNVLYRHSTNIKVDDFSESHLDVFCFKVLVE